MELHNVAEQILAFTMMLFQTELSCYMYSVIIQENGGADLLDYHVVTPPPNLATLARCPVWVPRARTPARFIVLWDERREKLGDVIFCRDNLQVKQ